MATTKEKDNSKRKEKTDEDHLDSNIPSYLMLELINQSYLSLKDCTLELDFSESMRYMRQEQGLDLEAGIINSVLGLNRADKPK